MSNPFHAYDIRGIYNIDLTVETFYRTGRAYCELFSPSKVIVGHDMRESSPELSDALITGLTAGGATVYNMGLASTDMMYLSVITNKYDGGFIITASHNPAKYNGVKIVSKNAIPLGLGSGLEKIEEIVLSNRVFPESKFSSPVKKTSFLDEYVSLLLSMVDLSLINSTNIVLDTGNGMGGYILPPLLNELPVTSQNLFFKLDGTFPNHEANPLLPENRRELEKITSETNAEFGCGLDGDCDRAFFVDENGEFINGDFMVGLLAGRALEKYPHSHITFCVRSSYFTIKQIEKLGGIPSMVRVGHAYAKQSMRELNAPFGGEVSGHYYYRYNDAWFDSGPLTLLVLMEYLGKLEMSLKDAIKDTRNYFISGEINSKVSNPDRIIKRILDKYSNRGKLISIDGVRIETDHWWFSVRKSNTEPLLRLNCEASSPSELDRIQGELFEIIKSSEE